LSCIQRTDSFVHYLLHVFSFARHSTERGSFFLFTLADIKNGQRGSKK